LILNEIKQQLEKVKNRVYYAIVDESVKNTVWDYIVFERSKLGVSGNKTSYSDFYDVHIVCENFIPEALDKEVITKMLEIDGMRLASDDGTYDYVQKPSTNIVVEMLTLHFVRARK
jgi:hypothetical protein